MILTAAHRAGLVEQVIDQLRSAVISGEWVVDSQIPPEPALAEALGVSRNTVREAVRALAHSGILEVRQGAGTYIRATSEVGGALRRLPEPKLHEVLQVRRCLEVEGARLAATARTKQDLAELRALLARCDIHQQQHQHEEFIRADTELHLAVVAASHNTILAELYRGLVETIMASIATTSDQPSAFESITHHGLVAAIADRDAELAAQEAGAFLDKLLTQPPNETGPQRTTR